MTVTRKYYPAIEKHAKIMEGLLTEYRKGLNAQQIMVEAEDYEAFEYLYLATDEIYCDICVEMVKFGLLLKELGFDEDYDLLMDWYSNKLSEIRGEIG